jgi:hypothetical protein
VKCVVKFGAVAKPVEEIHPATGLPDLITPVQALVERALGQQYDGLTIIFQVHPSQGLVHALQGMKSEVEAAEAILRAKCSLVTTPFFKLERSSSQNLVASSALEAPMDDPKQTEDPNQSAEAKKKSIADQVTDVTADAAAELASTAVHALAEGSKKVAKKRTPKRIKQAVASVNRAAAKGRAKKAKAKSPAPKKVTKASTRKAKTAKKAKAAKAVKAKSAKRPAKARKRSNSKAAKKRSKR